EYRAVAQLVGRGTEGEDAVVAVRPTVSYNRLKEAGRFATNVKLRVNHIQSIKNIASLAEFERDLIRERTNAGLTAARARGRNGGRPKGVDQKKQQAALALKQDTQRSVREICEIVGISRNTYYKYTRPENQLLLQASSRKRH
ncbi:MAG: recombinase family protein, partial [Herpetosiphonaceae bacterium]|nr:recombinase family protein [Herpetosiphonaceae bacterium]